MNTSSAHASSVYARLRRMAGEVAAFCAVGSVAALVDVGGSNLLHFGVKLGPLTAKALSTVASTVVAYLGNRLWTFRRRDRGSAMQRYAVFFALNGVGMAIALICVLVTRYGLGLTGPVAYNISANVVGIGLGTLFRFWSYRRWAFPPAAPAADVTAAPPAAVVPVNPHDGVPALHSSGSLHHEGN